jgi:hypothetical protein
MVPLDLPAWFHTAPEADILSYPSNPIPTSQVIVRHRCLAQSYDAAQARGHPAAPHPSRTIPAYQVVARDRCIAQTRDGADACGHASNSNRDAVSPSTTLSKRRSSLDSSRSHHPHPRRQFCTNLDSMPILQPIRVAPMLHHIDEAGVSSISSTGPILESSSPLAMRPRCHPRMGGIAAAMESAEGVICTNRSDISTSRIGDLAQPVSDGK